MSPSYQANTGRRRRPYWRGQPKPRTTLRPCTRNQGALPAALCRVTREVVIDVARTRRAPVAAAG